jgi:hypothetical protein
MVFEAEMNDVIEKKYMNLQVKFYFFSYGVFLLVTFSKYFAVLGSVLFLLSSLLLLRNIIKANNYYKEYIKKRMVFNG